MIFYASDYERWEDTKDPKFSVGMTPEGAIQEFDTQGEFWNWYYDIENRRKEDVNGTHWKLHSVFICEGDLIDNEVIVNKDGSDIDEVINQSVIELSNKYADVHFLCIIRNEL